MKMKQILLASLIFVVALVASVILLGRIPLPTDASGGWMKFENNPVLGGNLGVCFDVSVIKEENVFRMWFSWRPRASIALVESRDSIHWGAPIIALAPDETTGWEDVVNRPVVVKQPPGYHLWYTGQTSARSWIGHATSPDGRIWTRTGREPVLSPEMPWEKVAVMCPHVLWDDEVKLYKMWYSGGEQHEPDAIGYATSADGLTWKKHPQPVFAPSKEFLWESHKVTACQVIRHEGWYLMFYIGFPDDHHAQIGLARSRDGVSDWQRHPANPIIKPGVSPSDWDSDAVYKPCAVYEGDRWLLWYNGRRGQVEQIGLAIHHGEDLGFDSSTAIPQTK